MTPCPHQHLILTTNRTEDGAPVYAPCGDLREIIKELHAAATWNKEVRTYNKLEWEAVAFEQRRIADQLEAALHPSGDLLVARPLQIGVSYPAPAESEEQAPR